MPTASGEQPPSCARSGTSCASTDYPREDGSPILAIKAVLTQKVPITAELEFFFVEKEADRSAVLESLVRELALPRNLTYSVLTSPFEAAYRSTIKPRLDRIPRAPVFAFLDPFGYTGIPFSVCPWQVEKGPPWRTEKGPPGGGGPGGQSPPFFSSSSKKIDEPVGLPGGRSSAA